MTYRLCGHCDKIYDDQKGKCRCQRVPRPRVKRERKRKPVVRLSPLDVLACHAAGMSANEAAEHLGYSYWTVREVAQELGLKMRDHRTYPYDVQEQIWEWHLRGDSSTTIARRLGTTNHDRINKTIRRIKQRGQIREVRAESKDETT